MKYFSADSKGATFCCPIPSRIDFRQIVIVKEKFDLTVSGEPIGAALTLKDFSAVTGIPLDKIM